MSRALSLYLSSELCCGGPRATEMLISMLLGSAWPTGTMIVGPGMPVSYALVTNEVDPLVHMYGATVKVVPREGPILERPVVQLLGSSGPKTEGLEQDPRTELETKPHRRKKIGRYILCVIGWFP